MRFIENLDTNKLAWLKFRAAAFVSTQLITRSTVLM